MITLENVSKSYSPKMPLAVDDVSLEIGDGEILGLVGLNGAGKTTTIRMASGVTLPTAGHITVDGEDVVRNKLKASSKVGWIPEFPNFEPNARPFPLMRYFAGFYDLKGEEARKVIEERLASVGLANYLTRKLRTYSQGMKKRFSMAESLIGDPQNIMFDETLNGLDPEGVMFVRKMIVKLKDEGKAILLSSHILSEVENIADRVAVIHHGKLIKTLTKAQMQTLGAETIRITVDNPDDKLNTLLETYGSVHTSGPNILVTKLKVSKNEYPDVTENIIKNGYKLREFHVTGESLEGYFFSLVGDGM